MSAKKVLGLVLTGILVAGSLTACNGDGAAATIADTKAETTTAAGDTKAESDVVADTTAVGNGEKEALRVAIECTYALYNWTQPNDSNSTVAAAGSNEFAYRYDVMMVEKICKELGYDLGIVCLDWDFLIPAATTGQADCVITGQSITFGYLQTTDFAKPCYYVTIVTLVKEDNEHVDVKGVADLAGATYTSQQSTTWCDTYLPRIQDASVLAATTSTPDIPMSSNADKYDLIATGQLTDKGVLIAYPNFKMIEFGGDSADFQVMDEDINIGISLEKGNTELKDVTNSALTRMTKDDFSRMVGEAISAQPLAD